MKAYFIAAARGALDAGCCACAVALAAAGVGCGVAIHCEHLHYVRTLIALISTCSGIGASWLMVRIVIDRQLFATLAAMESSTLDDLDRVLIELGWTAASRAGPAARCTGARRDSTAQGERDACGRAVGVRGCGGDG
jgi:hypothetical protein